MFFIIQNFEQFALALKNRVCPEFTVLEIYIFIIQNLEQLALTLRNRIHPEFTVLNMYFLLCRILNNLHLPSNTEFALNFSRRGLPPPSPPPRTPLLTRFKRKKSYVIRCIYGFR